MNKQELFKKYNVDESHSEWDLTIDNWMSVEIFRVLNEGRLPRENDDTIRYCVDFLDKLRADDVFRAKIYKEHGLNFGSFYLTAKRMVYRYSGKILEELNQQK